MKISFCANLKTKPEQFFLSTDSEADKAVIRREFENLKTCLDMPAVKSSTQGDTIQLYRNKTKERCSYKMVYNADGFQPFTVNFNVQSVKNDVSGFGIFKQMTYVLAYLKKKFPESLVKSGDFISIAKLVYAAKK